MVRRRYYSAGMLPGPVRPLASLLDRNEKNRINGHVRPNDAVRVRARQPVRP